jgi:hypothetical protein
VAVVVDPIRGDLRFIKSERLAVMHRELSCGVGIRAEPSSRVA